MEVLNSYWVGEDGNYKFFEVILADPTKPSVNVSSAARQGKAFRGLTSAGNSRTPSKKKGLNKKLRRKIRQATPYHYAPYEHKKTVEKTAETVPKAKPTRVKGTKSKKTVKKKAAKKTKVASSKKEEKD